MSVAPPAGAGTGPTRDPAPRAGIGLAPGMLAYAALYLVVLPALLVAWMRRLDALLPLRPVASFPAGVAVGLAGAAVIVAALVALWRYGRGLPMSPFPPERLVTHGIYAFVADPNYVGAVLLCAGVAIAAGSAAGLWVVAPVLALASAAFVLGYERDATRRRFGRVVTPLISLPPNDDRRPSGWDRTSVYLLVFGPWIVLYAAVEYLAGSRGSIPIDGRVEGAWPLITWAGATRALAWPFVAVAPLGAGRRADLRRFGTGGLVALALVIPFHLLVPLVAPSFLVLWVCLAGEVYARRWPRLLWPAVLLAVAAGTACVTAGTHSVAGVVTALAVYGLLRWRVAVWGSLCSGTEAMANSWRERTVGPVRFLNHGVYAALGGSLGVAAGVTMAGPEALWWMVGMAAAAQVGAAVWAQLAEGSTQLLRPYGYFGSVIGVAAIAPIAWASGVDPWLLLAGMAVGACITQPFGRLRCLIQGCCHGRPVEAGWGIRYRHPRSRVLRLSALGGVPLHPTQLYSILSSIVVGAVLLRLWTLAAPLPFVAGSYLVLVGLARFVEEHYRGEPQTAWIGGLRLYQWLAIAFVCTGAGLTAVRGAPAPPPQPLAASAWPVLAALAAVTYLAYGVDFPRSNRRFSRLV